MYHISGRKKLFKVTLKYSIWPLHQVYCIVWTKKKKKFKRILNCVHTFVVNNIGFANLKLVYIESMIDQMFSYFHFIHT